MMLVTATKEEGILIHTAQPIEGSGGKYQGRVNMDIRIYQERKISYHHDILSMENSKITTLEAKENAAELTYNISHPMVSVSIITVKGRPPSRR